MTSRIKAALAMAVASMSCIFSATAPSMADELVTLRVHYPQPHFFKDVMAEIGAEFMARNPGIRIEFVTPSPTYEEGLQLILRQAGRAGQPDVTFIGLNRLRVLAEKNIGVDLAPWIAREGDMEARGFSERLLRLGQAGKRQVGLTFATSNPVMYYNADLVRRAGGDPDAMPAQWDGILALAARIDALGPDVNSMDFRWQGDDWMFSALLFSHGGRMMSDDESRILFDGPAGQAGVTLLHRMATEGKMPVFTASAGLQAFSAGRVGMMFMSGAGLRGIMSTVGDAFELRTASFPMADPVNGRLPTGGNAGVMLTTDPVRQEAAWKFLLFASGPYGASRVVPGTGYVPSNELAEKDPAYLKDFYRDNPLFRASIRQQDRMVPWYAFPGVNTVKVTEAIVDALAGVVEQKITPEEALKEAAEKAASLLPKK